MEELIQQLVQWLHTMGIHPSHETAAAVGDAVGQAGAAVGGAVAPVVAKMDMPALMALAAIHTSPSRRNFAMSRQACLSVFKVSRSRAFTWMMRAPESLAISRSAASNTSTTACMP